MTFRNGQWLKFDNKFAGAHVAGDGKTVGIFVKGGTDGLGQKHADRVMVVDENGLNIPVIVDGTFKNIELAPSELIGVCEVDTVDDLPAKRRESMREGFKLKADLAAEKAAEEAKKG